MKRILAAAALVAGMAFYGTGFAADSGAPTLVQKPVDLQLPALAPAPAQAAAAAPAAPAVAPPPAPAPAPVAAPAPAPAQPAMDKKIKEKLDAFYVETKDLRKQIVMKETEMTALMQHPAPDPVAAGKLSGELFDLYTTFQDKSHKAGLDEVIVTSPGMVGGVMTPFPAPKLDKSDD